MCDVTRLHQDLGEVAKLTWLIFSTFELSRAKVVVELFLEQMPLTCSNFIALANDGNANGNCAGIILFVAKHPAALRSWRILDAIPFIAIQLLQRQPCFVALDVTRTRQSSGRGLRAGICNAGFYDGIAFHRVVEE